MRSFQAHFRRAIFAICTNDTMTMVPAAALLDRLTHSCVTSIIHVSATVTIHMHTQSATVHVVTVHLYHPYAPAAPLDRLTHHSCGHCYHPYVPVPLDRFTHHSCDRFTHHSCGHCYLPSICACRFLLPWIGSA